MHASPRLRAISATSSPTYQGVHTMSPMHKSITALAASALLATVGFATAQSTDVTTTNPDGSTTTTTTTVDTAPQVIPAQPTGVIELAKPRSTVTPVTKQADGPLGMEN